VRGSGRTDEPCIKILIDEGLESMSEPFPPTNSDESGDKYEGLSTTGGEDAEVFEDLASAYVLHPCDTCILVFWRTKGQRDGGPMKVGVARRQRRQRRVRGRYSS